MPPAPIYKGNMDGSDGWTKRAGFEGESARDAGLMLVTGPGVPRCLDAIHGPRPGQQWLPRSLLC